jgi:hypothetical protein
MPEPTTQFKSVFKDQFIEFRPCGEDFALAAQRSDKMGILHNSYTKGAGRMHGMLGEIAVGKYLDGLVDHCGSSTYGYDFETNNGIKIEVKTKRSNSIPKGDYNASVEKKKSHMFENDLFVFVRAHETMTRLWLVGWVKTDSFKRRSDFIAAGGSDKTGFTYRVDGYHIPINKLKKMDLLNGYLTGRD